MLSKLKLSKVIMQCDATCCVIAYSTKLNISTKKSYKNSSEDVMLGFLSDLCNAGALNSFDIKVQLNPIKITSEQDF